MSMPLHARTDYIRNQAGVYISCCNQILDSLAAESCQDLDARAYLSQRLSLIASHFFSEKKRFIPKFKSELDERFSHINKEILEILAILEGTSELYPLPELFTDGAGELKERIPEEDLENILEILQAGVEKKVEALCVELKRETSSFALSGNVEIFEKISNPRNAIAILEKHNPKVFKFFSEEIRACERVGIVAVKLFPQNFQFLSSDLRRKQFIALIAISKDPHLFEHVDLVLKDNLLFITKAIKLLKQDCLPVLSHLSDELKDRFVVFDLALTYNKSALMFASERLKSNPSLLKKQKQEKKSLFCHFFRGQSNLNEERYDQGSQQAEGVVREKFKQLKLK